MQTQHLQRFCQLGYLILLLMLLGWFIYQGMNQYSLAFTLLFWLPLLLPLPGVLKANPYTFAWGGFILCLYLIHGLTLLYVAPEAMIFAICESLLVISLIIGFGLFARIKGKELGLGLKKKKP